MKKVLLIGTGGTIASEMTEHGLAPELDIAQLLSRIPSVADTLTVDCEQLMNLDSTNITPEHWLRMAGCIQNAYDRYDGFVITHGTDTMAYTAAALSYLIQASGKPIVLTGAQKPIGFDSTDSKINLSDALKVAVSDMGGVFIVFNNTVILGTRAQKTRSKSFQAFSSINFPELGVIRDGALLSYFGCERGSEPRFFTTLNSRVGLLKLIPGASRGWLDFLASGNDAVIIESFGVGGLPEAGGFFESVRECTEKGKIVVLTTQVQNEGSDLTVYRVGHSLKSNPCVLEAYDMTTEAALAKLMWILGQTREPAEVRRLFYRPVANDIMRTV